MPREDTDVAEAIRKVLGEDGLEILCESTVERVERDADGQVVVSVARSDGTHQIVGSHILVAAGRIPNSDTLDPARAGLELNDRDSITVNDRLETNVPGIFALGDINGGPSFTHVSYDDFRILNHRVLICDRDARWSQAVREQLAGAGVQVVQTPFRAPNANAHAERFVRSIKRECLDRLVPLGERHFRQAVAEYVAHYDGERPHQGRGNNLLRPARRGQPTGPIRRRPRLGGILNTYARAA